MCLMAGALFGLPLNPRPLGLVSPWDSAVSGDTVVPTGSVFSPRFLAFSPLVPLLPDGDCTIYFYPGTDAAQKEFGSKNGNSPCSPEPLFL